MASPILFPSVSGNISTHKNGAETVQIISAIAEQLEQWLEQDPRLSSKPFGETMKASPSHVCREIAKAAVDASANTSIQYVAVNANKILLRSQMLIRENMEQLFN